MGLEGKDKKTDAYLLPWREGGPTVREDGGDGMVRYRDENGK